MDRCNFRKLLLSILGTWHRCSIVKPYQKVDGVGIAWPKYIFNLNQSKKAKKCKDFQILWKTNTNKDVSWCKPLLPCIECILLSLFSSSSVLLNVLTTLWNDTRLPKNYLVLSFVLAGVNSCRFSHVPTKQWKNAYRPLNSQLSNFKVHILVHALMIFVCLEFLAPLESFSLICKFWPMLGTYGHCALRVL